MSGEADDLFASIDIYEVWREARAEAPVAMIGVDEVSGREQYWVLRHDDCERVLRDHATFSSTINNETMAPVMDAFMVGMDGDEHRRYRDIVAHAFRASALQRWADDLVAPTIHAQLDVIAPFGRADLVRDVTLAFPARVIAAILGVPVADAEQFQAWAEDINLGPMDYERSKRASAAMGEYLAPIVAARRAVRGDDVISDIVNAEVDGHRLDDVHVYGFLKLLLPAGAETTYRLFGSALLALLTNPDALARVYADRTLIPAVVEEALRWEASVTIVNRVATRDVEIGGVAVPEGSSVLVALGSANRDESRYDGGDQWELSRAPKPHLAFGTGHHQCLGMHLARLELRTGVEAVLDRLPNLRLDPDAAAPAIVGVPFRGPAALPVLFDRSAN